MRWSRRKLMTTAAGAGAAAAAGDAGDEEREREGMAQNQGIDAIIQE